MEQQLIKIPKDRIAVLIGIKGQTKKLLEKKTHTKIKIDSETGDIEIIQNKATDMEVLNTTKIVNAIARGFSPENALSLLDENKYLEIISLVDYVGKNSKQLKQKKGRIIGEKGKIREILEKKTNTKISVYGKTVSIIGTIENIFAAKSTIEQIIQGKRHEIIIKNLNTKYTNKEFNI